MRAPATASPFGLSLLGFLLVPALFHLAIVLTSSVPLAFRFTPGVLAKLGLVSVAAAMHWGIYASLLATFGLTLRRGREPIITTMVRRLHGEIDDEIVLYTRKVTIAWTLFFAMQLVLSVSLLCCAPLVVWSFFVNILDLPLIATMFASEYAIRIRCLQNPPRDSLSAVFSMITAAVHEKPVQQRAGPGAR